MQKEEWENKIGFIAATIGSAIGIGNIWRFPYIMGQNGGGSFLLVYLVCVLLLGIPLMLLEIATGRKFKKSVLKCFEAINPKLKKIAFIPVLTMFFILSYYLVVTGWVLGYFLNFFSGNSPVNGEIISQKNSIIFTLLSLSIVGITVFFGVRAIEKTSKILVPFLFILVLFLVVNSFFYEGAIKGLLAYLKPEYNKIFSGKTWLVAAGQALFSLSAGYGILITYGNYLKKKESIVNSTIAISFADVLFSILSSIVIFSAVYSFGLSPAEGPRLTFIVMPQIFQQMSHGRLFGSLFFLLVFLAALTSAISMLEFFVKNFLDFFGISRKKSLIISCLLLGLLSSIVSMSYSGLFEINLLQVFDNIFGNYLTLISAMIISIVIAWYWKIEDLISEMYIEEDLVLDRIGKIGSYIEHVIAYTIILNLIKFIVPIMLFLLFVFRVFLGN